MSCSITSPHDIEEFQKLSGELANLKYAPKEQEHLIRLPRGGIIVKTSIGNVQFGMPPETVKDSMIMGIDVPVYYVVPSKRFDFNVCLNVAEFEFPAYFNFFIRKKQATLICTKETEKAIRTVFQETLLGPLSFDGIEDEFNYDFDKEAIPNFNKELKNFAKNPFNPAEPLQVETLVNFIIFDETKSAKISDEVSVKQGDGSFLLIEKGKTIAIIPDDVEINDEETKDYRNEKRANLDKIHEVHIQDLRGGFHVEDLKPLDFKPPVFGVTVLGNSHGFDPKGFTSGYIIWVNGRGVLVDPPPFATYKLKKLGIPDALIEWIIISHCHGDHDAGAFQKILDTDKVEIITTPTIMGSFVRKYAAITNKSQFEITPMFKFRPVTIGSPCFVNGSQFKFFYSLHTIPAIGFEVFHNGKSLYFSADTFYDPEKMKDMIASGIISQKRFESLTQNKWNHDLILHEAGVPPIHTPMKVLAGLSDDIKKNLLLVHVAEKDIPKDSGLKSAPVGIENTIVLVPAQSGSELDMMNTLDIICSIELFQNVNLRSLRDLIQSSKIEIFEEGQNIITEGELGDKFYIIIEGIVRVYSEKPGSRFQRFYQMGDHFGETIMKKDIKRTANVSAHTRVKCLTLRRNDFLFIFGANNDIMEKVGNLIESRQKESVKALRKQLHEKFLNKQEHLILKDFFISKDSIRKYNKYRNRAFLWKKGDKPEFVFLINKGTAEVTYGEAISEDEDDTDEFTSGVFIGETKAILSDGKCRMTVKAETNLSIFKVPRKDYVHFLDTNPKLLVTLANKDIIE